MKQPNSLSGFPGQPPRFVDLYVIDAEHNNKHTRFPHVHEDMLELYYVYGGEGRYIVADRIYEISQGDLVVCNAGVIHGDSAACDGFVHSYCIAMTGLALPGLPENHLVGGDVIPVLSAGMLSDYIGEIFRLVCLLAADPRRLADTCTAFSAALVLLVREMFASRARNNAVREPGSMPVSEAIKQYVDAHYLEQLTLSAIADALHFSEYHVSHVFKHDFGVSPMQYVLKRRIGEAQTRLINTECPIGDIAYDLNFNTASHFNSLFRKYVGMSPSQYRSSFRKMKQP